MTASTVRPFPATRVPATVARFSIWTKLIATATPTEGEPPLLEAVPSTAEASATALASVLADDRNVTAPSASTVTAAGISATDEVNARFKATAAATVIGPSEVSAEGSFVVVVPETPS